jgi:hypothetical protein
MMQRVFNIFRSVFTGSDRERLVCVAAGQLGWYGNTNRILEYLYDDGTFWPGATKGGCDMISGAPYLHKESQYDGWHAKYYESVDAYQQMAQQYDIGWNCYEGGIEEGQGDYAYTIEGYNDYKSMVEYAMEHGCDLYVALTSVSMLNTFGHLEYLGQQNDETVYPYQVVMDLNALRSVSLAPTSFAPVVRSSAVAATRYSTAVHMGKMSAVNSHNSFNLIGRSLQSGLSTRKAPAVYLHSWQEVQARQH